jgi:hypothetical protein
MTHARIDRLANSAATSAGWADGLFSISGQSPGCLPG